jgi:hypothetical protein
MSWRPRVSWTYEVVGGALLACGAVIVAVAVMTIGAIVGRYWSKDDD